MVPSIDQRIAALVEIVPLLPLQEPRALFSGNGRGRPVVPWIQYYVSDVNGDDADHIAALLGTSLEVVHAELEAFGEARSESLLETRDVLPSLGRVFDFETFARHHDDDGPAKVVWWTLCLPVLAPSLDTAFVTAQLGGTFGAEDFFWLAQRTMSGWTLRGLRGPSEQGGSDRG